MVRPRHPQRPHDPVMGSTGATDNSHKPGRRRHTHRHLQARVHRDDARQGRGRDPHRGDQRPGESLVLAPTHTARLLLTLQPTTVARASRVILADTQWLPPSPSRPRGGYAMPQRQLSPVSASSRQQQRGAWLARIQYAVRVARRALIHTTFSRLSYVIIHRHGSMAGGRCPLEQSAGVDQASVSTRLLPHSTVGSTPVATK